MNIILKYLMRNIWQKKFRTLISVLSIAIAAALFFASTSVSDTVVGMYTDSMKRYTGNADLVIRPAEDAAAPFYEVQSGLFPDQLEYQIGAVEGVAMHTGADDEITLFKTLGIAYGDLQRVNPFSLAQDQSFEPFAGKKVIVSKETAEKLQLALGDSITLEIGDTQAAYTVSGLAESTGLFQEFGGEMFAVIPKSELQTILGLKADQANLAYVKLKAPEQRTELIEELEAAYGTGEVTVREAVSQADIEQQIGGISSMFLLLTLIISLFSIFIIYSSFKVIAVERVSVMGVFRSIGATKRTTGLLLFGESLLYGIAGGVLGCGIGIGLLWLMGQIANQTIVKGAAVTLEVSPDKLLFTFVLAVVLSLISAWIPVSKATKIPLKDIIIGKFANESPASRPLWKKLLQLLPLALAALLPFVTPPSLGLPGYLLSLILLITGVILAIPVVAPLFAQLLEKLYGLVFGNVGLLAVKNIKSNKNILNNISLLAAATAILLMINMIISGILLDLTSFYTKTVQFDISVSAAKLTDATIEEVKGIDGVDDVYGVQSAFGIGVAGKNMEIGMLEGADPDKYGDYWNILMYGDKAELMQKLDEGRHIILNTNYQKSLGVDTGDTITLKMAAGEEAYEVIGFMKTRINDGRYAIISADNLAKDMQLTEYSALNVKAGADPAAAAKKIRAELKDATPLVNVMDEVAQNDLDNNAQLFLILRLFLVLAVLVGVLSVMNNLLINFMERKRSLAMMRSVGMSKRQVMQMLLIEAFSSGVFGGLAGVLGGLGMAALMPSLLQALNQHIEISYSPAVVLTTFLAGVFVMVAASIRSAAQAAKLNIMETIRMN